MGYEELVDGYRALFTRLYTLKAIGDRWLSNIDQWRAVPDRPWIQKPLGRFRPFIIVQTLLILKWYMAPPVALRLPVPDAGGHAIRLPRAVPQTLSYLAYFIHLREYTDKVVAKEWKFNYVLDNVDTTANRFGEAGAVRDVRAPLAR